MIKWLRKRVGSTGAAGCEPRVSRADVLWCYRTILGREPESEAALVSHLGQDYRHLVQVFLTSPEFVQRLCVPVTAEDVRWCYRHLFGREPESAAAITAHLSSDFRSLIDACVMSPEYAAMRQRSEALLEGKTDFQRADAPPIVVETAATPAELQAAVARIRDTWSRLGDQRPHFSVITEERFRPEQVTESMAEFWKSGEAEAAQVERILARHGCDALSEKVCVEFGCGVGRVTMGFARRFAEVHGYDISAAHLSHAAGRMRELGTENVNWHLCDTDFPPRIAACDVFYSRIVLQHNPPPLIAAVLTSALAALKPGGVAIFQVPTYRIGYSFRLRDWLAAEPSADMEMHCLPQPAVFALIANGQCLPLAVLEDNAPAAARQFISHTFVVRKCA